MSIFWLFAYLETFDFFFEPIFLHHYRDRRIIRVNEAFDYHLTKENCKSLADTLPNLLDKQQRWERFTTYLEIIKNNIENGIPMKPDSDKALIDAINRKSEEEELFESIDINTEKKDYEKHILFKEEIDKIKQLGARKYFEPYFSKQFFFGALKYILSDISSMYFNYKREYHTFPKRR